MKIKQITVQSSAVIKRSNIVRYCINNCRNWGRISIRCWIHKRHPIPLTLTGKLRGVFCEYLWENRLHYNGTTLYFGSDIYHSMLSICLQDKEKLFVRYIKLIMKLANIQVMKVHRTYLQVCDVFFWGRKCGELHCGADHDPSHGCCHATP